MEFTPKRKGRPRIHPIGSAKSTPRNAGDSVLRKRLRQLYRCLMDLVMDDGRQPILVFMEKPSKKLYPDYYRVIAEPIDMVTIDSNIKNDRSVSRRLDAVALFVEEHSHPSTDLIVLPSFT